MTDIDDDDFGAGFAGPGDDFADSDGFGAMDAAITGGVAYALFRHGQDRQTEQLVSAINRNRFHPDDLDIGVEVHVHGDEDDPKDIRPVNFLDFATSDMPQSWNDYVGQEPLKRQLMVYMKSAQARNARFPHTLLASGYPGVGKTAMARLIAKTLGVNIIELVPPFNIYTLVEAAKQLNNYDILFIDEALALDTPIPTPRGWTTVGELEIDDQVLGASGAPVRVKRLTPIATDHTTYRVTFDDGESIVADAGHKWLASPRVHGGSTYLKPRVVSTQQMIDRATDWRVPLTRPVDLPEADLPVDPYVLGQWLGNGNAGQGYINVRTELETETMAVFRAAGEQVKTHGPISTGLVRLGLNDAVQGDRARSSFRNRLEALGIYYTKALPEMYLRGSLKQRLALVQGLMDTDGYVDPKTGNCTFSNANISIINGMLEVLRSLGYTPRVSATKMTDLSRSTCWKIEFRGTPDAMPFRLRDTKKIRPRKHKNMRRIVSIEQIESVPVRCIEVDSDDHLFLAGRNWTVTHNCHKLADNGKRGAEILLKVLEEDVAFLPDGTVVPLAAITVIGATTDRDKLPEPVVDRFKIKPYFQAYSWPELAEIAVIFASRHHSLGYVDDEMCASIGAACRGTPRIIEEMVMACRDLALALGRNPTDAELLEFLEVESDGLTRVHIHYLTAMYQYFARETKDGTIEYIVGEAAIQQILRETKQGIGRIERFLVERGLVDRTPRGRRLTPLGIAKAQDFVARGKGAADVA